MYKFLVRQATIEDADFFYDVKKIVLKSYIDEIWGWDEDFQLQFHKENFHLNNTNIITVNGIPAGTVEISENEQRIFICSLYLLPEYQNQKIGTTIIEKYISEASKKQKTIELEVLKLNVNAQRLYKSLGFTLTEGDDTKYFMYKACNP